MLKHSPILALTVMLIVMIVKSQCDYDFQHRIIEAIVKLELENTNRKTDIAGILASIEDALQTIEEVNGTMQELKSQAFSGGSTYVRWGRQTCPEGDSVKVYDGLAGGSHHGDTGSGSNLLCLPKSPIFKQGDYNVMNPSKVYGTQYGFGTQSQHHEVLCSVCWIPRSSNLMLPARNECYPGWKLEYHGILAGPYNEYQGSSEYVCIDEHQDINVTSSAARKNGARLYYAVAQCGVLPCDHYTTGRILTCAVCSYTPSTNQASSEPYE